MKNRIKEKTPSALPPANCTVIEVRVDGKLHDLYLEVPEHAVKNALVVGGPYQEIRVAENPRGYALDFLVLDDLVSH